MLNEIIKLIVIYSNSIVCSWKSTWYLQLQTRKIISDIFSVFIVSLLPPPPSTNPALHHLIPMPNQK